MLIASQRKEPSLHVSTNKESNWDMQRVAEIRVTENGPVFDKALYHTVDVLMRIDSRISGLFIGTTWISLHSVLKYAHRISFL
jgi:hypothetical protein